MLDDVLERIYLNSRQKNKVDLIMILEMTEEIHLNKEDPNLKRFIEVVGIIIHFQEELLVKRRRNQKNLK